MSENQPARARERHRLPLALRLKLALGYPFGLRRVSGRQLAVVYRMGHFHSLRGPREYRVVPLVETVRQIVSIAPAHLSEKIPNLVTKDGLLFESAVELQFAFDPRTQPYDKIMTSIRRMEQTGGLSTIVRDNAQSVLLGILGRFMGEQVGRNEVTQIIQQEFLDQLEARLADYGIHLIRHDCFIREFIPPPALRRSLEEAARRMVEVDNLDQFTHQEVQRAIAMKVAESLRHMRNGMPQVNDLVRNSPIDEAAIVRGVLAARTAADDSESATSSVNDAIDSSPPDKPDEEDRTRL